MSRLWDNSPPSLGCQPWSLCVISVDLGKTDVWSMCLFAFSWIGWSVFVLGNSETYFERSLGSMRSGTVQNSEKISCTSGVVGSMILKRRWSSKTSFATNGRFLRLGETVCSNALMVWSQQSVIKGRLYFFSFVPADEEESVLEQDQLKTEKQNEETEEQNITIVSTQTLLHIFLHKFMLIANLFADEHIFSVFIYFWRLQSNVFTKYVRFL